MANKEILAEKHDLIGETKFHLKSFLLILRRIFQNLFSGTKKFSDKGQLKSQPIIAVSESELWNEDDNEQNWILTAGKTHNLRVAAKRINGIEVPADEIFSFWKHLGNPNIGKNYVIGREIREGCIIPTIAGGLCQLSNALYDAALKANFEIIERYRHTKVVKGSLAEQNRDATVKWNYVDLRFRSKYAFKINIEITASKLIIQFWSAEKNDAGTKVNSNYTIPFSKLNDCYSCGNFECFKYPGVVSDKKEQPITTFILDERWIEFDDYIKKVSTEKDFFITPLRKNNFINSERYNWTITNPANERSITFTTIQRMVQLRLFSGSKRNIFSLMLRLDEKIAKSAAKKIPIQSTHLVVSQNLLPFLWEEGVFGGRTFDVLMTRLPIEKLHQRLDLAHANFPESKTLNDFRASQQLIELENIALTKSRHIITPHKEIAEIFNNKSIKLDWVLPKSSSNKTERSNKILFPASLLGKKGAYEVKRLAKELAISVVVTGKATEGENFWDGITIDILHNVPFEDIGLVIYPTYIEHQPRLLLKALAAGIPIITTTASGLIQTTNVTIIPIGDFDALKQAVQQYLNLDEIYPSLSLPMNINA